MRVACLLVPDLSLHAELRARPELRGRPFVVASGSEGRAHVIAVSPAAARLGLHAGRSIAHARAVIANLGVRVASPALENSAREALLDAALSLSPRAVAAPPCSGPFAAEAVVWVDANGVDALHGSERGFASKLGARSEALGLPGIIVVASSRNISHWIARRLAGQRSTDESEHSAFHILGEDAQARVMAPLPLDLLEPSDALAERLTRFGVRTVRDLLRLPRRQLHHRLGPEALELVARASGSGIDESIPEPDASTLCESIDLEYPLDRLEPMRFALRGLLARIVERLELRSLACRDFDLELSLTSGGSDARRIGVAAATTDIRVLLRLASLALENRLPEAAVDAITLRARGLPQRSDQLDFFLPAGPDPKALDHTLAELESLCSPGRNGNGGGGGVGSPAVADDHRPGAYTLVPFLAERRARERQVRDSAPAGGGLAVRALRPAAAAEVRVEAGRPAWLRSSVAHGHVVQLSGPWRTTGRWWSEGQRYAVDHYDVSVSDGTVLRLCFDWTHKHWSIDAIYD